VAPWWWFPCKPKHIGAAFIILIFFNNVVCISWLIKCLISLRHGVTMKIFFVRLFLFSTCFGRIFAHHQDKQLYLRDTWYLFFSFHPAYQTVIHTECMDETCREKKSTHLVVSILATGTRVRGFKPARSRWIFWASEESSVCLPPEG
jgi:hypothetical protein